MKPTHKNNKWIYVLIPLVLIAAVLAYYHLLYQPETVDHGLVRLDKTFKRHENIVTAVRFSQNDSMVITGSVDSTIQVWKRNTGEIVHIIRQPEGISYFDLSNNGELVATGSYDEVARIWRVSDGVLLHELKGHTGTIWTVAFSPDGSLLATGGDDKKIRLWEVATGNLVNTLQGHTRIIWALKFSPDGSKLASCSFDFSIKTWDVATGKMTSDNRQHTETVVDIAFSHDGSMLASTSDDCTIKLWRTVDGSLIRTMKVPEHVQAVAFSPDDKLLMTGGRDKTQIGELVQTFFGTADFNKGVSARLWETSTGRLLQTFTHHTDDVMDIAFSHDGKWIATASADHTVDVWEAKRKPSVKR